MTRAIFTYSWETIPTVTAAQMREVDRLMVEVYGIELLQMAEHAGRHLAELTRSRFLEGDALGGRVHVLAGTGGNGAGGLVSARRLHGWGARVTVTLTREPESYTGVPARELDILRRLGVPSGLDATTGETRQPTVRAAATLTIALPKTGSFAAEAAAFVGELYLADIGVSPQLHEAPSLGLDVGPLLARADIVRLTPGARGPR